METVKKNVKNIIVAVVLIIGLIVVGIYNLRLTKAVEEKRSSYLRTEFDYIVEMPTEQELSSIKSISGVESVYPFHLSKSVFVGSSKAEKVGAIVSTSEYKDVETIGFLGNGTLIKGSFEGAGAVLDEKASEVLNAGVGDTISFMWGAGTNRKKFTQKVKAVCHACSYNMYTNGLVLLDYTQEMLNAYDIKNEPYVYTNAFVKGGTFLQIKQVMGDFKGVDDKSALYEANAKHKTEVVEKKVNTINLGLILAVIVLYSGISALFIVINKNNDKTERDSGVPQRKMFLAYALGGSICALAVSVITFAVLLIFGISTTFIDVGIKTVLSLSLPALIVIPVTIIVSKVYTNKLYANNSKQEITSLRDE